MKDDAKRAYEQALAQLDNELALVEAEYAARISQIVQAREALSRHITGTNSTELDREAMVSRLQLRNKTHSEAARWALEKLGHPSRVIDISDFLLKHGYSEGVDRRVLANSLYIAMNRKPEAFTKGSSGKWQLLSKT